MAADYLLPDSIQFSIDVLLTRLRLHDATQYFTLVKMHLSFATDLSTDECDGVSEENSTTGMSRWALSPFVRKLTRGSSASRSSSESIPLTDEGVKQASLLMKFINQDENLVQEGLFRKTGSLSRQQELRTALLSGSGVASCLNSGLYNAHDCASVLKGVLHDLPEPLLQEGHYNVHCRIAEMCCSNPRRNPADKYRQIKALRLVFLLLPNLNYALLKELLLLLNRVSSYKQFNRMTSINLGTMFAPHILCPRKMSASELQTLSTPLSSAVAFMIENATELFQIPIELEIDVRQYWTNKKHTRTDSVKHSVSDAPTSTIFTFIDRKLTAQANEDDMTQVALAELYAYVQSIPDSTKKRRLIRQFNEASGCGTPNLNHSRQKKDLKIKTLGDSIKKHLFSKAIKNNKKSNLTIKGKSFAKEEYIVNRAIMTPRSRCPIAINSTSSLSSNEDDTKSVDEPMLSSNSPTLKQNGYEGIAPDKITIGSEDDVQQSSLNKMLSSSSTNSDGTLFGSFFKQLSTGSLVQLASRLTSMSSLRLPHHSKSYSPHFESEENVIPELDESLSSVFKDYLVGRSVLTENPIDLSMDGLSDSKHNLADDDSVFNEGSYVPSSGSSRQDSKASSSTVCSMDSGVEQLSDSLLYCLDGNLPEVSMSQEQRLSISSLNYQNELRLPSPKKLKSETFSQSDIEAKENAAPVTPNLFSCSPNSRRRSLLKTKQGTPIVLSDEHLRMCDEEESEDGAIFETSF